MNAATDDAEHLEIGRPLDEAESVEDDLLKLTTAAEDLHAATIQERVLEPRTLRVLAVRSNQLSYEAVGGVRGHRPGSGRRPGGSRATAGRRPGGRPARIAFLCRNFTVHYSELPRSYSNMRISVLALRESHSYAGIPQCIIRSCHFHAGI